MGPEQSQWPNAENITHTPCTPASHLQREPRSGFASAPTQFATPPAHPEGREYADIGPETIPNTDARRRSSPHARVRIKLRSAERSGDISSLAGWHFSLQAAGRGEDGAKTEFKYNSQLSRRHSEEFCVLRVDRTAKVVLLWPLP